MWGGGGGGNRGGGPPAFTYELQSGYAHQALFAGGGFGYGGFGGVPFGGSGYGGGGGYSGGAGYGGGSGHGGGGGRGGSGRGGGGSSRYDYVAPDPREHGPRSRGGGSASAKGNRQNTGAHGEKWDEVYACAACLIEVTGVAPFIQHCQARRARGLPARTRAPPRASARHLYFLPSMCRRLTRARRAARARTQGKAHSRKAGFRGFAGLVANRAGVVPAITPDVVAACNGSTLSAENRAGGGGSRASAAEADRSNKGARPSVPRLLNEAPATRPCPTTIALTPSRLQSRRHAGRASGAHVVRQPDADPLRPGALRV